MFMQSKKEQAMQNTKQLRVALNVNVQNVQAGAALMEHIFALLREQLGDEHNASLYVLNEADEAVY